MIRTELQTSSTLAAVVTSDHLFFSFLPNALPPLPLPSSLGDAGGERVLDVVFDGDLTVKGEAKKQKHAKLDAAQVIGHLD